MSFIAETHMPEGKNGIEGQRELSGILSGRRVIRDTGFRIIQQLFDPGKAGPGAGNHIKYDRKDAQGRDQGIHVLDRQQEGGSAKLCLVLRRKGQDLFVAVTHQIPAHPAGDPRAQPRNGCPADRYQCGKQEHTDPAVYDVVHITGLNTLVYNPFHLPGQSQDLHAALGYDQKDQCNAPEPVSFGIFQKQLCQRLSPFLSLNCTRTRTEKAPPG